MYLGSNGLPTLSWQLLRRDGIGDPDSAWQAWLNWLKLSRGVATHPPSAICQRRLPPTCPWTCYRPRTPRSWTEASSPSMNTRVRSAATAAAAVEGNIGGQSMLRVLPLLFRASVSPRLTTIMLRCTNMMFLACSMVGDGPEGVILDMTQRGVGGGDGDSPKNFQPISSRRSHWKRGRTVHFDVAPATGCCRLSALAAKWAVSKQLKKLGLVRHCMGKAIPREDPVSKAVSTAWGAHFTPSTFFTLSTVRFLRPGKLWIFAYLKCRFTNMIRYFPLRHRHVDKICKKSSKLYRSRRYIVDIYMYLI